jgi:hypothetical protein
MKLKETKMKKEYYCCKRMIICDCEIATECFRDPITNIRKKCVTECCHEVMCDSCCLESCDKSRSSLYIQERIKKDITNYNRLSDETVYLLKHIGPVCTYCGQLFKINEMKSIKIDRDMSHRMFRTNNELIPTPNLNMT